MIDFETRQEFDVWNFAFASAMSGGSMSAVTSMVAEERADDAVRALRHAWDREMKRNPDRRREPIV